jgi:hypothetical protein
MQLSLISVLSQYLLTFLHLRLLYTKIVDIKFIEHNAFLESLSSVTIKAKKLESQIISNVKQVSVKHIKQVKI